MTDSRPPRPPRTSSRDTGGIGGPPQRAEHALLHRDVGALQLLRDAGAADSVHDGAARRRAEWPCRRPRRAGSTASIRPASTWQSLPGGWVGRPHPRDCGARFSSAACIIAAGHFSMAVPGDATFYLGLILIVIGTGLLKPNISAMVGELYAPERSSAGTPAFPSTTWESISGPSPARSSAGPSGSKWGGTGASLLRAWAWSSG